MMLYIHSVSIVNVHVPMIGERRKQTLEGIKRFVGTTQLKQSCRESFIIKKLSICKSEKIGMQTKQILGKEAIPTLIVKIYLANLKSCF